VTAVVVANPTSLHAETTLEAVRAGRPVLVEKPVSDALVGLDTIQREASEQSVPILVGYQFRYHPTLRRVRDDIGAGRLGHVVSVQAHWGEYLPDWHPNEDYRRGYSARADLGGGAVRTLSHPIDYLRWVIGEVSDSTGFTAPAEGLDTDVEGVAAAALRFSSGALGTLSLDYAARPARHVLHVTGTAGSVEWDGFTGSARMWLAPAAEPTVTDPPAGFARNDLFLEEMRHFLACCAGDEDPACTLVDGVRALEIGLQILSGS
jgi:predicted dehydrogenase